MSSQDLESFRAHLQQCTARTDPNVDETWYAVSQAWWKDFAEVIGLGSTADSADVPDSKLGDIPSIDNSDIADVDWPGALRPGMVRGTWYMLCSSFA